MFACSLSTSVLQMEKVTRSLGRSPNAICLQVLKHTIFHVGILEIKAFLSLLIISITTNNKEGIL